MFQSILDSSLVTLAVAPVSASSVTTSIAVDMKEWGAVCFILTVGVMTSGGTIDAKVQCGATSTPTTDVTSAALVQIADTGGTKIYSIDVKTSSMLAILSTARYMRLLVTPATQLSLVGAIAIRYRKSGSLPPTQSVTQDIRI